MENCESCSYKQLAEDFINQVCDECDDNYGTVAKTGMTSREIVGDDYSIYRRKIKLALYLCEGIKDCISAQKDGIECDIIGMVKDYIDTCEED